MSKRKTRVTFKSCLINRRGALGVLATDCNLQVRDCQFVDERESSITSRDYKNIEDSSVYFHPAFLQIGQGAHLTVLGGHFKPVKDRHIFVVKGSTLVRGTKFESAFHECFYFGQQSQGELIKIESSGNAEECIVAKKSLLIKIRDSIFRDGGLGNDLDVDNKLQVKDPVPEPALKFFACREVDIQDCRVTRYVGGGIALIGSDAMSVSLTGLQIEECGLQGVFLRGTTTTMKDCRITKCERNGVLADKARLKLEGGQFEQNQLYGLRAIRGSQVSLSKTTFQKNRRGNTQFDKTSSLKN